MTTLLNFCYGSNMSSRRLQQRVSKVQFVDIGWLTEYKLAFHKRSNDGSAKCDACYTGNANDSVCGVVFAMTHQQLLILDEFEGLGKGYDRKEVQIIMPSSKVMTAVTYYATDIDRTMKPYHWYKEHVLRGAEEHQLPKDYIDPIKAIEAIPDSNVQRHEHELKIYQ